MFLKRQFCSSKLCKHKEVKTGKQAGHSKLCLSTDGYFGRITLEKLSIKAPPFQIHNKSTKCYHMGPLNHKKVWLRGNCEHVIGFTHATYLDVQVYFQSMGIMSKYFRSVESLSQVITQILVRYQSGEMFKLQILEGHRDIKIY